MSLGRRVTNSISQNSLRGFNKAFYSFPSGALLGHRFEDLQQTPTFPRISFRRKDAFPLEIHVINQRVASHRRTGHAVELLLHTRAFGSVRFGEHFRKRLLQTFDQEFRLEIDGVREELAQLLHLISLARLNEVRPRVPRAISRFAQDFRERQTTRGGKADELRKTFIEWAARPFWVPDEVTDPEGGKILARIPRGKSGQRPIAFVLPDFLPDAPGLSGRKMDRGACQNGQKERHDQDGSPAGEGHTLP